MDQLRTLESAHRSQRTRRLGYRLFQLEGLYRLLREHQSDLEAAIATDYAHQARKPRLDAIITLIALESQSLLQALKNGKAEDSSVLPARSVLVVGSSRDSVTSLLDPLTYAIGGGACALLLPHGDSPQVAKMLQRQLPRYLDREAYGVLTVPIEEALSLGFEVICHAGLDESQSQTRLPASLIDSGSGINVLAHLDPEGKSLASIVKTLDLSVTRQCPRTSFDAVIVLKSEIDSLQNQLLGIAKDMDVSSDMTTLRHLVPGQGGLHLFGASSSEEVLLALQKCKLNNFVYFGDLQYGEYMAKFLPAALTTSINSFNVARMSTALTKQSFQHRRPTYKSSKPEIRDLDTTAAFPELQLATHKPYNFFLTGLETSKALTKAMDLGLVVGTVALGYAAWRRWPLN